MLKIVEMIKKAKKYVDYISNALDIVIAFIEKFDGVIKLDADLEAKIDALDKD